MLNVINNTSGSKAANGTGLFSATHVAEERRSRSWLDARIHDGKRSQFTEENPVVITPVLAEVMLERNVGNRTLRYPAVEKYRRALRDGRWQITHQGIAFDKDGILRDGQHRLTAIVDEGRDARMVVTFGIAPEAFAVMDTGSRRTAGDVLEINNRGGGRDLAAAARCILVSKGANPRGKRPLDNDEIDAFIRDTPDLVRFFELAAPVKGTLKAGIGLMAGLYLVHEVAKPTTMMDFMNKVRTGVGFSDKRDAALALRNGLISGTIACRYPLMMAAATVLAWNLWCRGRPARAASLRWNDLSFPLPERA